MVSYRQTHVLPLPMAVHGCAVPVEVGSTNQQLPVASTAPSFCRHKARSCLVRCTTSVSGSCAAMNSPCMPATTTTTCPLLPAPSPPPTAGGGRSQPPGTLLVPSMLAIHISSNRPDGCPQYACHPQQAAPHISPHSVMVQGSLGRLAGPVPTASILRTTIIPSPSTLPNTQCLPSNQSACSSRRLQQRQPQNTPSSSSSKGGGLSTGSRQANAGRGFDG